MNFRLHRASLSLAVAILSSAAIADRISPDYPAEALHECIEGYVILSLTVTNNKATDVTIIDSFPKGLFEEATLANVQRMYFDEPDGFKYEELRFNYELDDQCAGQQPNKALQQPAGSLSRRLQRQPARQLLAAAELRR